jgi:hypothetical protein
MKNGAPEGSNIEPSLLPSVLEKLEEWDHELKHLPEVILRLRELDSPTANPESSSRAQEIKPVPAIGPKRSGPSL